jgi:hypothetical protein
MGQGDEPRSVRSGLSRRRTAYIAALSAVLVGCGANGRPRFEPGRWLSAEPAQKSALLTLRASGNGVSLGGFNGYARGQVLVEIPTGWRVTVHCLNVGSAPMSCAIVDNSLSKAPAFTGAATADPTVGLASGSSATFSFLATRPGSYRIACLVDDEEIGNGMWEGFQVGGTHRPVVKLVRQIP